MFFFMKNFGMEYQDKTQHCSSVFIPVSRLSYQLAAIM